MIGRTISHYRIVDRLGGGGMGVVYRAEDVRLARTVACKFLPRELTGNEEALRRFRREALAVSALNHPNICTLYDVCEDGDQPFMVMELLEGRSLDTLLASGPLELGAILRVALQVAEALEAAHAKGIIHRDIKPANVFVTDSGPAKVLDFGLAKLEEGSGFAASHESETAAQGITVPGMPMGTASYMSPEQVSGEAADARSDVFSFGAVLYEMATGRQAFEGPTVGVIFGAILHRAPLAPRAWNRDLPFALQEVILRALEKDPAKRYQSISDMRADLQRLTDELDSARVLSRISSGHEPKTRISSPPMRPAEHEEELPTHRTRRRTTRLVVLTTLPILAVAIAGFVYFYTRPSYLPCVVVGELATDAQVASPGLPGFILKRTLSQFPDLTVYDRREFDLALRLERSSRDGRDPEQREGFWAGLWLSRRDRLSGPVVEVSGNFQSSVGSLLLELELSTKGRTETIEKRYRGFDHFVNEGVDELARTVVSAYDSSVSRQAPARSGSYRPAVVLLSRNLDALRHYWRGAQAWNHLDMGLAEHEFRSSLEIDPTFALARLLLGEVRVFQNQWSSARSEIIAAGEQSAALTEIDRLRLNALLARVSGDTFEERVQLEKLIGLQPHRKEYVYELAESYFHTADVDDAIAKYREAIALDDRYALAYNHLAYCYAWKGDHAKALELLNRYQEIDPSPNAYDSLGDASMHAGNYRKAAEYKSRALEMDRRLYYARRSLVFVAIFTGRLNAAREMAGNFLAETADDREKARFVATIAYIDLASGKAAAAASACSEGLRLVGNDLTDAPGDELIWLKGLSELERGNPAGAEAVLPRFRRLLDEGSISAMNYKPAYKYYLHLAAATRAAEGRKGDAAELLRDLRFVRDKLGYWSTPFDRAFFMDAAGQIYEEIGDNTQAETSYRDAIAYNPHFALARFHLGRLLWTTGGKEDCRRELELFRSDWSNAEAETAELQAAERLLAGN